MELVSSVDSRVIETIKDIFKDKVVCELGAGNGVAMDKINKYAKMVVGIELWPELADFSRRKGLYVIIGDMFDGYLPEADIYFLWWNSITGKDKIIANLRKQKRRGLLVWAFIYGKDNFKDGEMTEFIPVKGTKFYIKIYEI